MPIGVAVDSFCVLLGGLLGGFCHSKVPSRMQKSLPTVFGFVAITMGVMKIAASANILTVTLSVLLGCVVGELLDIDARLRGLAGRCAGLINGQNQQTTQYLVLGVVAFCASGTGIFGALEEGFSSDASILLSKAGLDFFTALIFASIGGYAITLLCVPQLLVLLALFFGSRLIFPLLSTNARECFLAVGGVITMMNGCAIAKISEVKAANAIPALVIVMILGNILR